MKVNPKHWVRHLWAAPSGRGRWTFTPGDGKGRVLDRTDTFTSPDDLTLAEAARWLSDSRPDLVEALVLPVR